MDNIDSLVKWLSENEYAQACLLVSINMSNNLRGNWGLEDETSSIYVLIQTESAEGDK